MSAAYSKQAEGTLEIAPNARHEINQGKYLDLFTLCLHCNQLFVYNFSGGDKKAEKEKEAAEAAAVARQNQLNEQQAQGDFMKNVLDLFTFFTNQLFVYFSGVKSPVSNGDPRNESIISDASADITVDSVRDHTNSLDQ